jgi:hypothetical protein
MLNLLVYSLAPEQALGRLHGFGREIRFFGPRRALGRAMRKRLILCFCSLAFLVQAASGPKPDWTLAQQERFLRTARILSEAYAGKGINDSKKAVLTDGRRKHTAHIQFIDVAKPVFHGKDGSEEKDFKDTWKFNVAAYRLARLVGLARMVPPSVQRTVDGKQASVTWWLDGIAMDERDRIAKSVRPPDVPAWNAQMDSIRVFDQLIYNMDRSQENLLIGSDWRVYMIDHTRAFRKWPKLRDPAAITKCSPELLRNLKALTRASVARELAPYLTDEEIDALMTRRGLIVEKLEGGESVTLPAKATAVPRR